MPIENALASVAVRDVHAAVIWYESLGPPARPIRRYAVLKTEQNASSIARNLAANSLILICSVLYSEQEGPKTPQKLRNRLPIYNERRDWSTKAIPYAAFSRILFGTAFSAL